MTTVFAPGKVMIAGEYAVLEGRPCLVAAVDLCVRARASTNASPEPPEVAATRLVAERHLKRTFSPLVFDTAALRRNEKKLGLGSSAACAVACAAFAVAETRSNVFGPDDRGTIFEIAREGHAKVSAGGSGADVAASAFGGVLSYAMDGRMKPVVGAPPGVQRIVWTGVESRTHALLPRVRAAKQSQRLAYANAIARIADATDALVDAWQGTQYSSLREAVSKHHEALRELGQLANAPIVEAHLGAIASIAAKHGGAAKPSGAGGGDIALAVFPSEHEAVAFDRELAATNYVLVRATVGAAGVRIE